MSEETKVSVLDAEAKAWADVEMATRVMLLVEDEELAPLQAAERIYLDSFADGEHSPDEVLHFQRVARWVVAVIVRLRDEEGFDPDETCDAFRLVNRLREAGLIEWCAIDVIAARSSVQGSVGGLEML